MIVKKKKNHKLIQKKINLTLFSEEFLVATSIVQWKQIDMLVWPH